MAKVKLGNVKGPKGEQGVRGSKWYNTDKITGESTSGTAFPNSGIADAMVGDMALNPTTLNLYTCQTAGNAATAKWVFMACIKGPQGAKGDKGDPTTVDAALSESSTNPIQNKAVAGKFKDVQDSLAPINLNGCNLGISANADFAGFYAKAPGQKSIGIEMDSRDGTVKFVKDGRPFKTL